MFTLKLVDNLHERSPRVEWPIVPLDDLSHPEKVTAKMAWLLDGRWSQEEVRMMLFNHAQVRRGLRAEYLAALMMIYGSYSGVYAKVVSKKSVMHRFNLPPAVYPINPDALDKPTPLFPRIEATVPKPAVRQKPGFHDMLTIPLVCIAGFDAAIGSWVELNRSKKRVHTP